MNIVEINKLTQRRRLDPALKALDNCTLTQNDAVTLICYACKKEYGVFSVDKILTTLGIKKLKI